MSQKTTSKLINISKLITAHKIPKNPITKNKLFTSLLEPYEASNPKIVTSFPGPKAQEFSEAMSEVLFSQHKDILDMDNSFGNYYTDIDGNTVLDMDMDNGRNLLGYNSRKLVRETLWQKYTKFYIHRPAMGMLPAKEYPQLLSSLMKRLSTEHLKDVYFTCGCFTSANDTAIKIAYLNKFYEVKGNDSVTPQEEKSVFSGSLPGAPEFAVIGFEGGAHGVSLTTMSSSSCEHINLNKVVRFNWPIAPFPKVKYPYEEYEVENKKEEERCIAQVEEIIKETQKVKPIAAMIIEPIQHGVRYASNTFYNNLINLCYQYGITFICDEVNTAGWVEGKTFLHQRWNSDKPVHMATFGNRMQLAGLLYQNKLRPRHAYQIHSTWNGDAVKLQQVTDIIDYIGKESIAADALTFFNRIRGELTDIQRKWHVPIHNIRGIGKIFAFDLENEKIRNELVDASRQNGFKVGKAGTKSIVFTPALVFTEDHFAKYKNWILKYRPSTTLS
jgi:4-aminobutyrate aminotransferase/(S)-3-amino-2-methylpropionate transaminase